MNQEQVLVIAHRGAKGEAPENTMGSFRLGIEQGCDAIELDVHLSKDGEVIVCHDDTLNRTTDKQGYIHDMTVKELKQADAGRWFHEKYEGERIPLLEEVFDLAPRGMIINVEVKGTYGRKLEPALLDLIRRKDRLEDIVVSSFDHKILLYLKLLEPELKIGLLYDANVINHPSLAASLGLPVYSMHPNFKRIQKEDVQACTRQGLRVFPYTINDECVMKQAIDAGVSGIITDFPGRLRGLLSGVTV